MISVVLHAGPGMVDYTFHLANALGELARVGLSMPAHLREHFADELSDRVTLLDFVRPRRREIWGFAEMRRHAHAIREFGPDVFHLQADGVWESVLLRMVGRALVVNTIHDPIKHVDQRNLLNELLMRDAAWQARGWVVHSEALKRIALERFALNERRVLVHPLGSLTFYKRYQNEIAGREKFILFYGALRYNKGCDILLRAFDAVKDEPELDGWNVVVAGEGNGLNSEQEVMARLGQRLDFRPGLVSNPATADLFSRAGLVALPYRHATQSGVLAIASVFGCAVLATRAGNMPEIMRDGEHVLFADAGDEKSLADGLVKLAGDANLRSTIGRNLARLGETEWNWNRIAEMTLRFYEMVLREAK